ncbi:uncharacterized protein BDZ99DRAFT_469338 [Mytilinidion resinicola]|uniref:Uncharacterized protein n=1 Tax=Mytilinidion resinicola TaxID=574789 RepID=A0A6A6XZU7_9PEZI|nr:uncharacterized protein BDZ99DRAFT_469338 [Mytilinidion resinicola]KAF2801818.1 hypothetical protein BDZ99DRAFT_469338 [Mytilinidion resinicola]
MIARYWLRCWDEVSIVPKLNPWCHQAVPNSPTALFSSNPHRQPTSSINRPSLTSASPPKKKPPRHKVLSSYPTVSRQS